MLTNQIRLNGEDIDDKRIVEKILRSLTRKFEYIVVAIEESKDLKTLSLESLVGTLQSHELRMRQFDDSPMEQSFQVSTKLKGKEPGNDLGEDKNKDDHDGRTSKGEGSFKRIPFQKNNQQDESQEDAKFVKLSEETMFLMIEEDDKDFVDDCVVSLKGCDAVLDEKILGNVSDDVFCDELEGVQCMVVDVFGEECF
ncbi:hypothetical protein Lser_V15G39417 [Lactuca serriola]